MCCVLLSDWDGCVRKPRRKKRIEYSAPWCRTIVSSICTSISSRMAVPFAALRATAARTAVNASCAATVITAKQPGSNPPRATESELTRCTAMISL